jgi:Chloramphenicol phosphotransferase-like protein
MQAIFLIMGTPASGKSTVSRALTQRFERGLHIPVDDLRRMVVSGLAEGSFHVPPALDQLRLARATAVQMTLSYSRAGFAVAIDDFWHVAMRDTDYAPIIGQNLERILLLPNLEVTLNRLRSRDGSTDHFEQAIRFVHHTIETRPELLTGWHVVDSSNLNIEETVDRILEMTEIKTLRI